MQLARWQDTMAAIDARYTKTDYRVRDSARLSSQLGRRHDVEEEPLPDEDRSQGFEREYVWLKEAVASEPGQLALPLASEPKVGAGPLVLGRVLVGRERVRIEAMTRARHQELRARFERLAAGQVEFLGERADDLGPQTFERNAPAFDAALVPPRLRENPQQLSLTTQRAAQTEDGPEQTVLAAFRHQYATFADEPMPWLDGRTPRAAAADPALRPRLVSLMKTHIRGADKHRREEALDLDLNPLLADLGLHELIYEPPPLGLADDESEDDEIDDEASAAFDELAELGRGIGPHAVLPPLTEGDIEQRIKAMHARYRSPDSGAEAIDNEFPGLLDFLFDATKTTLEDHEFEFLEDDRGARVPCLEATRRTGAGPGFRAHRGRFRGRAGARFEDPARRQQEQRALRALARRWPTAGSDAGSERCPDDRPGKDAPQGAPARRSRAHHLRLRQSTRRRARPRAGVKRAR